MSDEYRIDSHKLMYHPHRVAGWLDAKDDLELAKKIYPIYIEISPVGYCNHRCTFCARDFMEYKKRSIDYYILKERIAEMAFAGVKSIMFAGEGEPLLYEKLPEIVRLCSELKIDTSLTTNFSCLSDEAAGIYVKNCKWIKVSINAGTAENYSKIHRVNEGEFKKVINNIKKAVEIKRLNNYKCTIGGQLLLVDDNIHSVTALAEELSGAGVDYLVIKPYSHHHESITDIYKNLDYSKYLYLKDELEKYNADSFKIIFRLNTFNKLINCRRHYKTCGAVPFFWAYIMSDGEIIGCSTFLEEDIFKLGNIHTNSFKEIWEGKRRLNLIKYMKNFDINACRLNCRMDEINNYLWELLNPGEHVNFI